MTRRAGDLLALLLLGMACADRRPEGDAIVVAMLNSPANLDPRVGADEASQKAQQLIFNTLVHVDDSLQIVPELAESLEHPDDLTYVARLHDGVLFHNGRELTADDVVYTFRSFPDPDFRGRSGAYRLLGSVAASSASGDERRVLYAQAQRFIAGDVPYISLWYKTNVAVFQPDLQGVRLSPTADFLFLKDVHRSGAPLTAGGAE
jgi:ABC-type transport system substrate-binding protein